MRKFKKTLKYIGYTLLYLIISVASAFGAITLSMNHDAVQGNKEIGEADTVIPAQITSVVDNIASSENLDIGLGLVLNTSGQNVVLNVDALVCLGNGLSDMKLQAKLNININGQPMDIDIAYENESVYIDAFGGKFMIETSNIMSTVNQLVSIAGVEMPDLGLDMENLSVDTILQMFSDLTETKDEQQITLDVNLPMVGLLRLVTDNSYYLQSLSIPSVTIGDDTSIALDGTLEYPESAEIEEKDANDYFDLTSIASLATDIVTLAKQDAIGLDFNVAINEFNLEGNATVDLKQKAVMVETSYQGIDVKAILLDKTLYLEVGNVFAKFALEDLGEIKSLLDKFGIDLPIEQIVTLMGEFSIENIEAITGKVDISSLDLSFIEGISSSEGITTITISGIGQISLNAQDGLKNIDFTRENLTANLAIVQPKEVKLALEQETYVDLALLCPVATNLIDFIDNDTFTANLNLTINNFTLPINAKVMLAQGLQVQIETQVYSQTINAYLADDTIYVHALNSKFMLKTNEIQKLISDITTLLGKEISMPSLENVDIFETIKEILGSEEILITRLEKNGDALEVELLGKYAFTLNVTADKVSISTALDNILTGIENISLSGDIFASVAQENLPEFDESEYTKVTDILSIVKNVWSQIESKTAYLELSGNYKDILFDGAVNIVDGKIEFAVQANYQEVGVKVALQNNRIYLTVGNINLFFDLQDIDSLNEFINQTFNVEIPYYDTIKALLTQTYTGSLQDLISTFSSNSSSNSVDIEEILNSIALVIDSNHINLSFKDIQANVTFENETIGRITATLGSDISAQIIRREAPIEITTTGDYVDIMKFTKFIDMAIDIVESGHIDANAKVEFLDDGSAVDANLQVDFSSIIKLGAVLSSQTIKGMDISFFVQDEMLYFNYNGLCLKIDNSGFKEIVSIVLDFVGVDPSTIPFLDKVDLGFDLSQASGINLKLDPMKMISLIGYIKGFTSEENSIIITLDGNKLYNGENINDMIITINSDGTALTGISMTNIYTSDRSRMLKAELALNDWNGFNGVDTSKNYVDLTGANELVKALANMVQSKDFHLKGTFDVKGKLVGIPIEKTVPFDINVKIVNGEIEASIVVGEIPVIPIVNNDVDGKNRMAYIYYKKDAQTKVDTLYFYRTETVSKLFSSDIFYEQFTKTTLDNFLADPFKYLQYCVGFSDTIMDAIREALEKSANRTAPIDYSKIINSFTVTNSTNFAIQLNMEEITNNSDISTMDIALGLSQDSNGKNYISDIDFSIYMPIASIFDLTLTSNDASIVDYGTEVDMSGLYSFVNSYSKAYDEEWVRKNGSETLASQVLYHIYFEENGGEEVSDIESVQKASITLPTLSPIVTDNGIYQKTLSFAGWYTSSDCKDGEEFTETLMPRKDITLYAKWEESIVYYHTITFVTNGDMTCSPITKLTGSEITLFDLVSKEETIGNTTSYYTFEGWFTSADFSEAFTQTTMPDQDVTLYAKWNLYKTETTSTFKLYHNDDLLVEKQVIQGSEIVFNHELVKEDSKFYHDKDYQTEYTGEFVMGGENIALYVRNKYNFTYVSAYGNVFNQTFSLYEGEAMPDLPSQQQEIIDDDGENRKITYTLLGYNVNGTIQALPTVMPDNDVTVEVVWEIDTKYYYTIDFCLDFYVPLGWTTTGILVEEPQAIASERLLEGTVLDLTQEKYVRTTKRKYTKISATKTFNLVGWETSALSNLSTNEGFTTFTVTGNQTLYACWKVA